MDHLLLWGDLHNHNSVGLFHYARGTLERSIEIARSRLDFFAFTGHARWPDMPEMPGGAQAKWAEGFDYHRRQWPVTRRLVAEACEAGRFTTFVGYEWHSAASGDRTVLYPGGEGDLFLPDDIHSLTAHARAAGAILVPHHTGYRPGLPGRGTNWDHLDEEVSPVVEIYSEHGAAERDRGPFPYHRHSNGPRTTTQTLQHILEAGFHLGVVASTDDHLGCPGAYGEGLAAVYARENTREAVWEALRNRRTYAVTGDRIALEFHLNDAAMGEVLPAAGGRTLRVSVRAWDELAMVEVVRNGEVVHRAFPPSPAPRQEAGRWIARVEFGWGPWSHLGMPRTADWLCSLALEGGGITAVMPCFQSGPFDEERRNRILQVRPDLCRWQSYTAREGAFAGIPTNAVALEIDGGPGTVLDLTLEKPVERRWRVGLAELADSSRVEFTGGYPAEAVLLHRLVPEPLYALEFTFTDRPAGTRDEDWYYVRVRQENGQMAWSSPIWVDSPS